VGVASILILSEVAAPALRNMLILRNASPGVTPPDLFISFGVQASANSSIRLTPGGILIFDIVVPQNDIYVIASAAGGTVALASSNFTPT
jgi:hypothetical protein